MFKRYFVFVLLFNLLACSEHESSVFANGVKHSGKSSVPANKAERPDVLLEYQNRKSEAAVKRKEYSRLYSQDLSAKNRSKLLADANLEFEDLLVNKLFPSWYGTPWAFNGTTQEPNKGSIACGYFVTTLLRDVGLNVQRARLAQQASENIIKTLVRPGSIYRFSNGSFHTFLSKLRSLGTGLYIVGLDFHVGFILVEKSEMYFIHASIYPPQAVTKELAGNSIVLMSSNYRVIGKLEGKYLMTRWLDGKKIKTIGPH